MSDEASDWLFIGVLFLLILIFTVRLATLL